MSETKQRSPIERVSERLAMRDRVLSHPDYDGEGIETETITWGDLRALVEENTRLRAVATAANALDSALIQTTRGNWVIIERPAYESLQRSITAVKAGSAKEQP